MKKLIFCKLFCIPIFVFSFKVADAQTLVYSYDESGNRIQRSLLGRSMNIVVSEIEIDSSKNSIDNPVDLNPFEEKKEPFKVKIYPNPTTGVFSVELPELQEKQKGNITIYSKMGKLVKRIPSVQINQSVDITNYSADVYLLYITVEDKTITRTLIKE